MLNISNILDNSRNILQDVNSVVKHVTKRLSTEYGEICSPSVFQRKQTSQARFAVPLKDLGRAYFAIFCL